MTQYDALKIIAVLFLAIAAVIFFFVIEMDNEEKRRNKSDPDEISRQFMRND